VSHVGASESEATQKSCDPGGAGVASLPTGCTLSVQTFALSGG